MRWRLVAAAGASAAVGAAGWKARALTGRGAMAATLVGCSAIAGLGWRAAALLGAFFASGSLLTRLTPRTQADTRSGERNERQVLANGGVAAVAGGLSALIGPERAFAMLAGAVAAAAADTWATEFGSTSSDAPRLILSGQHVRAGMSGGVTARGHAGALAGAAALGMLAALGARSTRVGVSVTVAGAAGGLIDSILGELVQVRRLDASTGALTEADAVEGVPTRYHSGWWWVDNDVVNLACTCSGAVIALALYELAGGPDHPASLAAVRRQPPVGHPAD